MADGTAWRIERREKDGESWSEWLLLEPEAEDDGEIIYDDEDELEHDVIYQYRVRDADDDGADWIESNEIQFVSPDIGNGSAEFPFPVATLSDLQKVGSGIDGWDLDCHYIQTADIDASPTAEWNDGEGFEPIGAGDYFEGVYNGQHYKITGLTINRPDDDQQALFGSTIADAKVRNVHLVEANITGKKYTGSVAGYNDGNVSACSFSGDIVGDNRAGGIVGANTGSVEKCCSSGTMLVNVFGAGIAGDSEFTPEVSDCYSDMNIVATQGFVVGLCVTIARPAGIQRSYFAGTLSGVIGYADEAEYGIAGDRLSGTPDSFFDITKNPNAAGNGTPATTAEMQSLETYLDAGWDICEKAEFDPDNPTTWFIDDGEDYPRLWFEWEPEIPEAGAEATITIGAEAGAGIKRAEAGAEAGMGVSASGAAVKVASGGVAEAGIEIHAEGAGEKVKIFIATLRVPGIYDPDLRLEGVRLHETKH